MFLLAFLSIYHEIPISSFELPLDDVVVKYQLMYELVSGQP